MPEFVWGLLGALACWLIVDVVVGAIVGDMLLRPMQILMGPPAGKFVVVGLWATTGVLGYLAWSRVEPSWFDYWAWMGFFLAGIASLFAALFYTDRRRQRDRRGAR